MTNATSAMKPSSCASSHNCRSAGSESTARIVRKPSSANGTAMATASSESTKTFDEGLTEQPERPAPSAERNAISRRRAIARASTRLAAFALAMIMMSVTAATKRLMIIQKELPKATAEIGMTVACQLSVIVRDIQRARLLAIAGDFGLRALRVTTPSRSRAIVLNVRSLRERRRP